MRRFFLISSILHNSRFTFHYLSSLNSLFVSTHFDNLMEPIVVLGTLVHSVTSDQISILEKYLIAVDNGKIIALEKEREGLIQELERKLAVKFKIYRLGDGEFLCPGFIDMHIHAPQYPNLGLGLDKPLLEWLQTYTIPLESKYRDLTFAETIYNYVVDTTLSCGTTTACYFGTIFLESTKRLAEIIREKGQRALVGKVNMNRNSIDGYTEKTKTSLKETELFIQEIVKMNNPLIEPVVTPRFAISCDMELMKGLGLLAKKYNTYIQTHISENQSEVSFAKELFPDCSNYGDIYEKAGLLTNKTILAHGVFLEKEEIKLFKERGVALAHCASSNTYLKSGLCDVVRLMENGVHVGLGTDVSGGISPSIIDAMRSSLTTSIHLCFVDNTKSINYHQVFYMATLGGAKALKKDDIIGNFELGKDFDAIIINMEVGRTTNGSLKAHTWSEIVQKFIYCGETSNIKKVFVKGRKVIDKS